MCSIICMDIVSKKTYASLVAFISIIYSISLVIGPILGGVITKRASWRWVFLINVPIAFPAILIVFWYVPRGFPYHNKPRSLKQLISRATMKRVDLLGSTLLLLATLSLVAAVEEAGTSHGWRSAFVITLLVLSAVLWIFFLLWERYITRKEDMVGAVEPIFPWRFIKNRIWLGMILQVYAASLSRPTNVLQKCCFPRRLLVRHHLPIAFAIPSRAWHVPPGSRSPYHAIHCICTSFFRHISRLVEERRSTPVFGHRREHTGSRWFRATSYHSSFYLYYCETIRVREPRRIRVRLKHLPVGTFGPFLGAA